MANNSVETVFRGVDQTSGVLATMAAKAKAFEKSLQSPLQAATALAEKPLGVMKRVGVAAIGAGVAAGAVFSDLVGTGADFEKTMIAAGAKFSPAIRQGTKEFSALQATAEKVGAATEFNAQQAASGLKNLASAGFNAKQAIAALPGVVDLATASEVDLDAASEMATKSLGAFNLKTEDAAQLGKNLSRVNDVMSRTADATSASMEGLFQSILEGGPVATTAGASVETFMALAGQLAQSGIEASVAGTTLKNVFLTLAAPSKEAAAGLAALGIETEDAKGNMRDAVAILGELEAKTKKMGTAKKADVIEGIFGKIPIAGVSALLGGGIDKVAALRKELENATGSTARMAAIMRDSTKNDIDGFTSAIDGVKIALFNVAKGPFRAITQGVTEWTSANTAFIATKFGENLAAAIPIVESFGDGIYDSFLSAKLATDGVTDSLQAVFGGDGETSPRTQAYELANAVTDTTLAIGGFWLITKAASAATFVWGAVTKGVTLAVWLYEVAVKAGRVAMFWWEFQSKAGAAATVAMSLASGGATVQLYAQAAAARVASASLGTMALTAGVALGALAAVGAAIYQNEQLKKETGGKGILDVGYEWATTNKGLKEIADENLDKQAKKEAQERAAKAAAAQDSTSGGHAVNVGQDVNQLAMANSPAELAKGLAAINAGSGQLPPDMMGFPGGPFGAAPVPPGAPGGKPIEPQIALKEESVAKLGLGISRDVSTALKGVITIAIKDGKSVEEVSSTTGSGVQVTQSGGF